MTIALILIGLVALLLTGIPIFAGLGIISIGLMLVNEGQISSLGDIVFGRLNIYLLVAIPMFAFMAFVMIKAKVIDDLFNTAHTLVRHLPGGLGVATVLSCTIFAAISGSSVATAMTIGSTAIPQMKRFGYRPRETYGVVAAGGTLGILIPPSGPLILYGVVSETSIGAFFIAGLIPGLLLAFTFAAFCMAQNAWRGDVTRLERAGLAETMKSLRQAIWALLLPPLVLGGMYFGVFTATEAAGIGAVAALLIAVFIYRNFGWHDLFDAAYETTRMTAIAASQLRQTSKAGCAGHLKSPGLRAFWVRIPAPPPVGNALPSDPGPWANLRSNPCLAPPVSPPLQRDNVSRRTRRRGLPTSFLGIASTRRISRGTS